MCETPLQDTFRRGTCREANCASRRVGGLMSPPRVDRERCCLFGSNRDANEFDACALHAEARLRNSIPRVQGTRRQFCYSSRCGGILCE